MHGGIGTLKPLVIVTLLVVYNLLPIQATMAAKQFDNTQLLEDAANHDPEAQYTLAHLYLKGQGGIYLDVDYAIRWLELAAASGHRDAAFDLALLYLNGRKVGKDSRKALVWLIKAAELNQVDAMHLLGLVYKENDSDQAVHWFEKAVAAGHAESVEELAGICSKAPDLCGHSNGAGD